MSQSDEPDDPAMLRELLAFARFGFSGTLTATIIGLIVFPIVVYVLKDSPNATAISVGYITALVIGVVAFGFFSLRRVPTVVANLIEGKFEISEQRLASRIDTNEAAIEGLRDMRREFEVIAKDVVARIERLEAGVVALQEMKHNLEVGSGSAASSIKKLQEEMLGLQNKLSVSPASEGNAKR